MEELSLFLLVEILVVSLVIYASFEILESSFKSVEIIQMLYDLAELKERIDTLHRIGYNNSYDYCVISVPKGCYITLQNREIIVQGCINKTIELNATILNRNPIVINREGIYRITIVKGYGEEKELLLYID